MTCVLKAFGRIKRHVCAAAVQFSYIHPYLAFLCAAFGIPLFLLAAVALFAYTAALALFCFF